MKRFSETMLQLYDEILNGHTARQHLLENLQGFVTTLNKNVDQMLKNYKQLRTDASIKAAEERKKYVAKTREEVAKLRHDLAEELKVIGLVRLAIPLKKQKFPTKISSKIIASRLESKKQNTIKKAR